MYSFFALLLLSCWASTKGIYLETWPVTHGVEFSLKEWYGESLFPVMAPPPRETAQDSKCDIVLSSVISTLARKRSFGQLTAKQESRALGRFEACRPKLCSNPSMIDAFMQPKTFKEQIDLLIAYAKLGDDLSITEGVDALLNLLIDGELKDLLAGVPFPPKFTGNSLQDFAPYISVITKIVARSCPQGRANLVDVSMPAITEVFISSLNDRYTKNAITAEEAASVWNMTTVEEFENFWHLVVQRLMSPTSALSETCLDPAVAYYNYEKLSLTKIRQFALSQDLCAHDGMYTDQGSGVNEAPVFGIDDSSDYSISYVYSSFDYESYNDPTSDLINGGGSQQSDYSDLINGGPRNDPSSALQYDG